PRCHGAPRALLRGRVPRTLWSPCAGFLWGHPVITGPSCMGLQVVVSQTQRCARRGMVRDQVWEQWRLGNRGAVLTPCHRAPPGRGRTGEAPPACPLWRLGLMVALGLART